MFQGTSGPSSKCSRLVYLIGPYRNRLKQKLEISMLAVHKMKPLKIKYHWICPLCKTKRRLFVYTIFIRQPFNANKNTCRLYPVSHPVRTALYGIDATINMIYACVMHSTTNNGPWNMILPRFSFKLAIMFHIAMKRSVTSAMITSTRGRPFLPWGLKQYLS